MRGAVVWYFMQCNVVFPFSASPWMKPLDVALSYYNIGVSLSKKTKGDSIIDLHPDNYLL